jgi:hypothetical protein
LLREQMSTEEKPFFICRIVGFPTTLLINRSCGVYKPTENFDGFIAARIRT